MQIEEGMERGFERHTIRALRQLPRRRRTRPPVKAAAINVSRTTPPIADRTNRDWSPNTDSFRSPVTVVRIFGRALFTAVTTLSVDALPLRVTVSSTPRDPLVRTMLVWGTKASCPV